MDIIVPALFALHCFLGPVGVLPNMHLVEVMADYANIDIWSMVPSLVDELGETPHILAKLKSSKFICASGGTIIVVMFWSSANIRRPGQSSDGGEGKQNNSSTELDWNDRGSVHRQSMGEQGGLALVCFPSLLWFRVQGSGTWRFRTMGSPKQALAAVSRHLSYISIIAVVQLQRPVCSSSY